MQSTNKKEVLVIVAVSVRGAYAVAINEIQRDPPVGLYWDLELRDTAPN